MDMDSSGKMQYWKLVVDFREEKNRSHILHIF